MDRFDRLVHDVDSELADEFGRRMRRQLEQHDRDWLIDELVRVAIAARNDRRSAEPGHRTLLHEDGSERIARIDRLRSIALDHGVLQAFIDRHRTTDRETLIADGHLLSSAPPTGTALITTSHRSATGDALLAHAKDLLFGLLFGDAACGTQIERTHRELLTFALPRAKAHALAFMRAATEIRAAGTWQDPATVSNDDRADNVLMEVEYGETADESVGDGIVRCLSLINLLEVNEQILYARMIDIEQSTLIG